MSSYTRHPFKEPFWIYLARPLGRFHYIDCVRNFDSFRHSNPVVALLGYSKMHGWFEVSSKQFFVQFS